MKDEIGKCPTVELEIDVIDNSPFFVRLCHVKEEDKAIPNKELSILYYLDIIKEGCQHFLVQLC